MSPCYGRSGDRVGNTWGAGLRTLSTAFFHLFLMLQMLLSLFLDAILFLCERVVATAHAKPEWCTVMLLG